MKAAKRLTHRETLEADGRINERGRRLGEGNSRFWVDEEPSNEVDEGYDVRHLRAGAERDTSDS